MKSIKKVIKVDHVIMPLTQMYMVLKPSQFGEGWERHGKAYPLRGLVSLLQSDLGIDFIVPSEVQQDVQEYQNEREELKNAYFK